MIEILEPLAQIPGVRLVGLVTRDGVPVAVPGVECKDDDGPETQVVDIDVAAAIATQWLSDVTRTVGALTWPNPERMVLSAARGCLVLVQSPGSVLMAITDTSVDQEELRLRMDGVARRIGRSLRGPITGELTRRPDTEQPSPALPAAQEAPETQTPTPGPVGDLDLRTSADS